MSRYFKHTVNVHGSNVEQIVLVGSDGIDYFVPSDPANTDYQQYLEWVAEGNTPEPWQPDSGS